MAWSYIHILRYLLLFVWIFQCPQFIHFLLIFVDALVIKILEGFEFIIAMVFSYSKPPELVIGIYFVHTIDYLRFSSVIDCMY